MDDKQSTMEGMGRNVKNKEQIIAEFISKALKNFDHILMFIDGKGVAENLTNYFCKSEALKKTSKKILILSSSDMAYGDNVNYTYYKLNDEEQNIIRGMYMTYEFSDHFRILSDEFQFGGLLNYVKMGMMTMEEIFQVFLA